MKMLLAAVLALSGNGSTAGGTAGATAGAGTPAALSRQVGAPHMALITAAAQNAQQRCFEFMHEDADEFISCIDAIEQAINRHAPGWRYRQLGIDYFGWVGANNSARVALPGADTAARLFLQSYQRERRRLRIDERSLCAAVAGDCTVRLAQIRAALGAATRSRLSR